MQDVGQHQFLMLLFVVEADLHEGSDGGQLVVGGLAKEFYDRCIDVAPVGGDLIGARPGQIAAPVAGVTRPRADIVGIEQERIIGMVGRIALAVLAEQELLEKPGGMGAVPFCRARVRHGLDQLVLGA